MRTPEPLTEYEQQQAEIGHDSEWLNSDTYPNYAEEIIDKRIEQAERYYSQTERNLKAVCISASRVVGTYSGVTQTIAERIRRDSSTVENYAHAHWCKLAIRENGNAKRVRELWHVLPASHFWQAWTIHKAGYRAYDYLNNAALHLWSGREMMDEWKRDREAGNAPLRQEQALTAFRGLAAEIAKIKGLTKEQREAVKAVLAAFGEARG